MAYWWVSQNKTWKDEKLGGYLWAPKAGKKGQVPHHWATMREVMAGDTIFSYVNQKITAISVAKGQAFNNSRPKEFPVSNSPWGNDGFRIDVTYEPVKPPLPVKPIAEVLLKLLPDRYSPLTQSGTGNEGYLFHMSPAAASFLLERIGNAESDGGDILKRVVARSVPSETTKEALTKSRIGQGRFREDVMRLCGGLCVVTGFAEKDLLRASHIKPWSDSNNLERLDPFNGFLLSPSYDAAFDAGYITFENDATIQYSSRLSTKAFESIGISSKSIRQKLDARHLTYLEYHRKIVFLS
jgi:putative restriction endonuclease